MGEKKFLDSEKLCRQPGTGDAAGPDPAITLALLSWYDRNRRRLPWREDPSAYHVWLSEIMLQQTRVEAVKGYYARFLEALPDLHALAEADEDKCLKLWEGLGYYSRVRNLRKAAGIVVREYGGEMPKTSKELRKLPGIGPYTSAAIASIAFGEKCPAVDGNLLRIFARLSLYRQEIRTKEASAAASGFYLGIMPDDRPGDFNQALMDLGSAVCTPGDSPACSDERGCPLQAFCGAFRHKCWSHLPLMPAKRARRVERRTILLIREDDMVLLHRRPAKGLLAGLYEFPNEEGWLTEEEAVARTRAYGFEPVRIRALEEAKHVFTHKEWHMHGFEILCGGFSGVCQQTKKGDFEARSTEADREQYFSVNSEEVKEKYAIPGAYSTYLSVL